MIIFGYSGHSYVVIDIAKRLGIEVKYYFDKFQAKNNPYNLEYLGSEETFDSWHKINGLDAFPTVGNNATREVIWEFINLRRLKERTLISKSALIGSFVELGSSTMVGENVVINSHSKIGIGCILNTASVIEHECEVGNFVHIAPGSVLAGNVKVGNGTFIGAGAVIKNGIKIGKNCIVGAGAVVVKDIPDEQVCVGNPAKELLK